MFVFMSCEKLNSNSFVFYFLLNHQFAFVSFWKNEQVPKCYELHPDSNSILKQKNLLHSLSSNNLTHLLFLPLNPDMTLALNLNFSHFVHVLSKLGDVCVWFTSHSIILVTPLSLTSNFHLFIHRIASRGVTFWT